MTPDTAAAAQALPLNDAILNHPETRHAAARLVVTMTEELPEQARLYAMLTALAATFVGLCADHVIDHGLAFSQIADTVSGDLVVKPLAHLEALDVPLNLN